MSSPQFGFETISKCRLCQSPELDDVVDLGEQPLANALLSTPDEPEGVAPLVLQRCRACTAVQLSVTVDPSVLFRNYVWVTGTSASTVRHCRWLSDEILARVGTRHPRALEMASNDGTLLRELRSRAVVVLGVDPARNLAALATEQGLETIPEFLDLPLAREISATRGPQDIVIARNVLSHVPDPTGSMAALAECLGPTGIAVIEFHRADTIATELHYDSIYHEHTMFHSLKTMTGLLDASGLVPFDVLPSPISGGSWVIFAARRGAEQRPSPRWIEAWDAEAASGVWYPDLWNDFAIRVNEHRETLAHAVNSRAQAGKVVVAYGASARSSTVLNACGLTARELTGIADSNPLKQGRFAPGTRIPIEAPPLILAREPDAILLLAFNFREEIENMLRAQGWHGELIHAFPERVSIEDFE